MARKWHRCHNRRARSSNSNTTKGRQPLSSCSFTFIKDQTVSYLRKENSTTFFQCLLYLQHTLLTGDASPFHVSCSSLAVLLIYILMKRLSHLPIKTFRFSTVNPSKKIPFSVFTDFPTNFSSKLEPFPLPITGYLVSAL